MERTIGYMMLLDKKNFEKIMLFMDQLEKNKQECKERYRKQIGDRPLQRNYPEREEDGLFHLVKEFTLKDLGSQEKFDFSTCKKIHPSEEAEKIRKSRAKEQPEIIEVVDEIPKKKRGRPQKSMKMENTTSDTSTSPRYEPVIENE